MVESSVVDLYVSIIHHQDKGHTHTTVEDSNVPVCVLPRCFFKHSIFLFPVVRTRQ